jgi:hypothetical protein
MIYNDELLFIHVPKTGGMSLTHALVRGLKGQVYITVPRGHETRVAEEIIIEGTRHETLSKAAAYFDKEKRDLSQFKAIIAVARNPYDLEVSRFHYLRKGNPFDRGAAQELAMAGDFSAFAVQSSWWFKDFGEYYMLNGRIPDNMVILRFESLAADFDAVCSKFLKQTTELSLVNSSDRGAFEAYLTAEAEQAIFNKYRWLFDNGFYERITF